MSKGESGPAGDTGAPWRGRETRLEHFVAPLQPLPPFAPSPRGQSLGQRGEQVQRHRLDHCHPCVAAAAAFAAFAPFASFAPHVPTFAWLSPHARTRPTWLRRFPSRPAVLSFVINVFIVAVFAEAFYNKPDIDASDIDLLHSVRGARPHVTFSQRTHARVPLPLSFPTPPPPSLAHHLTLHGLASSQGEALEKIYGKAFKYIWALGLLAAGQSSTMTGTYAGVSRSNCAFLSHGCCCRPCPFHRRRDSHAVPHRVPPRRQVNL